MTNNFTPAKAGQQRNRLSKEEYAEKMKAEKEAVFLTQRAKYSEIPESSLKAKAMNSEPSSLCENRLRITQTLRLKLSIRRKRPLSSRLLPPERKP